MIVVPGIAVGKNRLMDGIAQADPATDIEVTSGVVMRSDVIIDNVRVVREPIEGAFFDGVSVLARGRVSAMSCEMFPGMEGQRCTIVFGKPKVMDNDELESGEGVHESDMMESSAKAPTVGVNTEPPDVTLRYMVDRNGLYLLGAKGGFVPDYTDEVNKWFADNLVGNILTNIPLSVKVINYRSLNSNLYVFDIENPHDSVISKENTGYDFIAMLPTSLAMQKAPERTIETPAEEHTYEVVSREDIVAEDLAAIDDEFADDLEQNAPQADVVDEAAAEHEDLVNPSRYTEQDHLSELSQDEMDVMSIRAQIRGLDVPDAAQQGAQAESATQATDEQPTQVITADASADDGLGMFDDLDDDFDDGFLGEVDRGSDSSSDDVTDKVSDRLAKVSLDLDKVDFSDYGLIEDKGEAEHREAQRDAAHMARADMANDGASSIADALTNSNKDDRFDFDDDGLLM